MSLLRLGDVIIAAQALADLRAKNPKAEIHLLINKSFALITPLLSCVDKIITFDREIMQQGLVEPDRPLFEPYDRLSVLVNELNGENYDQIINFTQNKFSGYLSSLVQAEDKVGLSLNSRGQASFGSPWFRFLNDVVGAGARSIFHYSDIFQFAIGGSTVTHPYSNRPSAFSETAAGREEYEAWRKNHTYSSGPKIVLQTLTSDSKKNWSNESWVKALKTFTITEESAEIIALGAPFEREKIELFVSDCATAGLKISAAILTLEGAFVLLNECDVLVSGDTSIKHLAAFTSIRTIEIALGSSDFRKTGALKPDSLILGSAEACAPCHHEAACHRERHFCSENLAADLVGLSLGRFLHKDWSGLRVIAEEYSDSARIMRTRRPASGFWYAEDLRRQHIDEVISENLDRAAWRFLLEREHKKHLAEYGTESTNLKSWIDENYSDENSKSRFQIFLGQVERETANNEERINRLLSELTRRMRSLSSLAEFDFLDRSILAEMVSIEKDLGLGQFLSEKAQQSKELGLFRARRVHSSLSEAALHQQIKLKLVRSLRSMITEYQ